MDSPDLFSLIGLIPPEYAPIAALVAEIVLAFSVLAGGIKAFLGNPKPSDPRWKKAFFAVTKWLDVLAVNTATVRQKQATAAKRPEIPPPPRSVRL